MVWGGCSNLNGILKLQKKAARLILDADHMSPSAPLFRQLGIMNVDHRIKYHKYLLMHKIVKGLAPKYLIDKFNYVSTNHTYLIRSKKNQNACSPKTQNSFKYSGSILCHDLPSTLCNISKTNCFNNKIKQYLSDR